MYDIFQHISKAIAYIKRKIILEELYMEKQKNFGEIITEAREAKELTRRQLVNLVGEKESGAKWIPSSLLAKIEENEVSPPVDVVIKLTEALSLDKKTVIESLELNTIYEPEPIEVISEPDRVNLKYMEMFNDNYSFSNMEDEVRKVFVDTITMVYNYGFRQKVTMKTLTAILEGASYLRSTVKKIHDVNGERD